MAKVPVIDIRPHDLEIVREILRRHVPNHEVLAFGSRVRWTARQYSDLDLAIRSDEAIPTDIIYAIKNELSESNLPMMVDVLDMASVSEKFRGIIEEEYAVVQEVKTTKPLGEVAEITMGQSPPGDTYNTEGDGLPFYQGVADFQGRYPKRRVYCTAPTRFAERGDILLSVRAPIGRVNLSTERCAIGRGLARIRATDSKDQTFLEFALRGESANWDILESQGSVFGSASKSDLMDLPIPWPERKERHATARILGALDDKIELNRRMNKTLEAMAQAIFKSWFVDFDPVHAKSKRRAPALPPALADLFPSQFQDSELGKIPRGWEVGTVIDLCDRIESGGTPRRQNSSYWENGTVPWFKTGELTDNPLLKSGECITDAGLNNSACKIWQPGTILIALYAAPTVGRMGILEVSATANQACSALSAKPQYGGQFLFHTLLFARDDLQQVAVGSAQQNINQQILREQPVLLPTENVASAFQKVANALYRKKAELSVEIQNLSATRDVLLPHLLSGRVQSVNAS